eukprot:gene21965-28047_t
MLSSSGSTESTESVDNSCEAKSVPMESDVVSNTLEVTATLEVSEKGDGVSNTSEIATLETKPEQVPEVTANVETTMDVETSVKTALPTTTTPASTPSPEETTAVAPSSLEIHPGDTTDTTSGEQMEVSDGGHTEESATNGVNTAEASSPELSAMSTGATVSVSVPATDMFGFLITPPGLTRPISPTEELNQIIAEGEALVGQSNSMDLSFGDQISPLMSPVKLSAEEQVLQFITDEELAKELQRGEDLMEAPKEDGGEFMTVTHVKKSKSSGREATDGEPDGGDDSDDSGDEGENDPKEGEGENDNESEEPELEEGLEELDEYPIYKKHRRSAKLILSITDSPYTTVKATVEARAKTQDEAECEYYLNKILMEVLAREFLIEALRDKTVEYEGLKLKPLECKRTILIGLSEQQLCDVIDSEELVEYFSEDDIQLMNDMQPDVFIKNVSHGATHTILGDAGLLTFTKDDDARMIRELYKLVEIYKMEARIDNMQRIKGDSLLRDFVVYANESDYSAEMQAMLELMTTERATEAKSAILSMQRLSAVSDKPSAAVDQKMIEAGVITEQVAIERKWARDTVDNRKIRASIYLTIYKCLFSLERGIKTGKAKKGDKVDIKFSIAYHEMDNETFTKVVLCLSKKWKQGKCEGLQFKFSSIDQMDMLCDRRNATTVNASVVMDGLTVTGMPASNTVSIATSNKKEATPKSPTKSSEAKSSSSSSSKRPSERSRSKSPGSNASQPVLTTVTITTSGGVVRVVKPIVSNVKSTEQLATESQPKRRRDRSPAMRETTSSSSVSETLMEVPVETPVGNMRPISPLIATMVSEAPNRVDPKAVATMRDESLRRLVTEQTTAKEQEKQRALLDTTIDTTRYVEMEDGNLVSVKPVPTETSVALQSVPIATQAIVEETSVVVTTQSAPTLEVPQAQANPPGVQFDPAMAMLNYSWFAAAEEEVIVDYSPSVTTVSMEVTVETPVAETEVKEETATETDVKEVTAEVVNEVATATVTTSAEVPEVKLTAKERTKALQQKLAKAIQTSGVPITQLAGSDSGNSTTSNQAANQSTQPATVHNNRIFGALSTSRSDPGGAGDGDDYPSDSDHDESSKKGENEPEDQPSESEGEEGEADSHNEDQPSPVTPVRPEPRVEPEEIPPLRTERPAPVRADTQAQVQVPRVPSRQAQIAPIPLETAIKLAKDEEHELLLRKCQSQKFPRDMTAEQAEEAERRFEIDLHQDSDQYVGKTPTDVQYKAIKEAIVARDPQSKLRTRDLMRMKPREFADLLRRHNITLSAMDIVPNWERTFPELELNLDTRINNAERLEEKFGQWSEDGTLHERVMIMAQDQLQTNEPNYSQYYEQLGARQNDAGDRVDREAHMDQYDSQQDHLISDSDHLDTRDLIIPTSEDSIRTFLRDYYLDLKIVMAFYMLLTQKEKLPKGIIERQIEYEKQMRVISWHGGDRHLFMSIHDYAFGMMKGKWTFCNTTQWKTVLDQELREALLPITRDTTRFNWNFIVGDPKYRMNYGLTPNERRPGTQGTHPFISSMRKRSYIIHEILSGKPETTSKRYLWERIRAETEPNTPVSNPPTPRQNNQLAKRGRESESDSNYVYYKRSNQNSGNNSPANANSTGVRTIDMEMDYKYEEQPQYTGNPRYANRNLVTGNKPVANAMLPPAVRKSSTNSNSSSKGPSLAAPGRQDSNQAFPSPKPVAKAKDVQPTAKPSAKPKSDDSDDSDTFSPRVQERMAKTAAIKKELERQQQEALRQSQVNARMEADDIFMEEVDQFTLLAVATRTDPVLNERDKNATMEWLLYRMVSASIRRGVKMKKILKMLAAMGSFENEIEYINNTYRTIEPARLQTLEEELKDWEAQHVDEMAKVCKMSREEFEIEEQRRHDEAKYSKYAPTVSSSSGQQQQPMEVQNSSSSSSNHQSVALNMLHVNEVNPQVHIEDFVAQKTKPRKPSEGRKTEQGFKSPTEVNSSKVSPKSVRKPLIEDVSAKKASSAKPKNGSSSSRQVINLEKDVSPPRTKSNAKGAVYNPLLGNPGVKSNTKPEVKSTVVVLTKPNKAVKTSRDHVSEATLSSSEQKPKKAKSAAVVSRPQSEDEEMDFTPTPTKSQDESGDDSGSVSEYPTFARDESEEKRYRASAGKKSPRQAIFKESFHAFKLSRYEHYRKLFKHAVKHNKRAPRFRTAVPRYRSRFEEIWWRRETDDFRDGLDVVVDPNALDGVIPKGAKLTKSGAVTRLTNSRIYNLNSEDYEEAEQRVYKKICDDFKLFPTDDDDDSITEGEEGRGTYIMSLSDIEAASGLSDVTADTQTESDDEEDDDDESDSKKKKKAASVEKTNFKNRRDDSDDDDEEDDRDPRDQPPHGEHRGASSSKKATGSSSSKPASKPSTGSSNNNKSSTSKTPATEVEKTNFNADYYSHNYRDEIHSRELPSTSRDKSDAEEKINIRIAEMTIVRHFTNDECTWYNAMRGDGRRGSRTRGHTKDIRNPALKVPAIFDCVTLEVFEKLSKERLRELNYNEIIGRPSPMEARKLNIGCSYFLSGMQCLWDRKSRGYGLNDHKCLEGIKVVNRENLHRHHRPGDVDPSISDAEDLEHMNRVLSGDGDELALGLIIYRNTEDCAYMYGNGARIPERVFWAMTRICRYYDDCDRWILDLRVIATEDNRHLFRYFDCAFTYIAGFGADGVRRTILYNDNMEQDLYGQQRYTEDIEKSTADTWLDEDFSKIPWMRWTASDLEYLKFLREHKYQIPKKHIDLFMSCVPFEKMNTQQRCDRLAELDIHYLYMYYWPLNKVMKSRLNASTSHADREVSERMHNDAVINQLVRNITAPPYDISYELPADNNFYEDQAAMDLVRRLYVGSKASARDDIRRFELRGLRDPSIATKRWDEEDARDVRDGFEPMHRPDKTPQRIVDLTTDDPVGPIKPITPGRESVHVLHRTDTTSKFGQINKFLSKDGYEQFKRKGVEGDRLKSALSRSLARGEDPDEVAKNLASDCDSDFRSDWDDYESCPELNTDYDTNAEDNAADTGAESEADSNAGNSSGGETTPKGKDSGSDSDKGGKPKMSVVASHANAGFRKPKRSDKSVAIKDTKSEEGKRLKLLEKLMRVWPELKMTSTVDDVKNAMDGRALPQMEGWVLAGKGIGRLTSDVRMAMIYVAEYAPLNTIIPSEAMREMLDFVLYFGLEIHLADKDSLDSMGYSVFFKEKWLKDPRSKGVGDEAKLPKDARMFYSGEKLSREQVFAMDEEDTRYIVTILNGRFYIDGGVFYKTGKYKGKLCIPARINCRRLDVSLNNVRFAAPNHDDVGEMIFLEFDFGQEVTVSYGDDYSWTYSKVQLTRQVLAYYYQALGLKGWGTSSRYELLDKVKEFVDTMTCQDFDRITYSNLGAEEHKYKWKMVLRGLVALVNGCYEEAMGHMPYAHEGSLISSVSFPEHLIVIRDFVDAVSFDNWAPVFDFAPILRAMEEVKRTGKLVLRLREEHRTVQVPKAGVVSSRVEELSASTRTSESMEEMNSQVGGIRLEPVAKESSSSVSQSSQKPVEEPVKVVSMDKPKQEILTISEVERARSEHTKVETKCEVSWQEWTVNLASKEFGLSGGQLDVMRRLAKMSDGAITSEEFRRDCYGVVKHLHTCLASASICGLSKEIYTCYLSFLDGLEDHLERLEKVGTRTTKPPMQPYMEPTTPTITTNLNPTVPYSQVNSQDETASLASTKISKEEKKKPSKPMEHYLDKVDLKEYKLLKEAVSNDSEDLKLRDKLIEMEELMKGYIEVVEFQRKNNKIITTFAEYRRNPQLITRQMLEAAKVRLAEIAEEDDVPDLYPSEDDDSESDRRSYKHHKLKQSKPKERKIYAWELRPVPEGKKADYGKVVA